MAGADRLISPTVHFANYDARLRAGVVLSPQGPDFSGYYEDDSGTSMDSVLTPLLIATGDNDFKPSNPCLLPEIRARTFENLPAFDGQHRFLYSLLPVGAGGHGSYQLGDIDADDADLSRLSLALSSAVRAFFDHHLVGDEAALTYLDSDKPRTLAGSEITNWTAK